MRSPARRAQVGTAHHGPRHSFVRRPGERRAGTEDSAARPGEAALHAQADRRYRARRAASALGQDPARVVGIVRGRRALDGGSISRQSLAGPYQAGSIAAYQPTLRPPSTARICPLTYVASLAKNNAVRTMSSGEPLRLRSEA